MKTPSLVVIFLTSLFVGALAGCSRTPTQSPDVSESIRKSLDQAGLKAVSVSQDRDKGVVTLGGQVATWTDKSRTESIAKSMAVGQVVADQIIVMPLASEIDIAHGPHQDQLGVGWWQLETSAGSHFRWTTGTATATLRMIPGNPDIVIRGYKIVRYFKKQAVTLTVSLDGEMAGQGCTTGK